MAKGVSNNGRNGADQQIKSGRVLFCFGVARISDFIALRPGYDACYVFESNQNMGVLLQALFRNDPEVHVNTDPTVHLQSFCDHHGIWAIDTLVGSSSINIVGLLRTCPGLIEGRRIGEIRCLVKKNKLASLKALVSEGFLIERSRAAGGKNNADFFDVRCTAKKKEKDRVHPRATTHMSLNIVYGHLRESEYHRVHKGNVTVLWSKSPVQGCDVYLYINAFSFTGRQEGLNVLFLGEPSVVLPRQYDRSLWEHFDVILTSYDAVIERSSKAFKMLLTRSGLNPLVIDGTITENREERDRIYPIGDRIPGICMINGNKTSAMSGELYSKRIEAALWFNANSEMAFDVYGNPPFDLPNYKGILPRDAKLSTMARYRFNLAFENTNHPVLSAGYVDKIQSCLETRTVPIYLGAPDITPYVPSDCFIDFRSFAGYRDLEKYLTSMSDEEYRGYVARIDDYVAAGGLRPYSWNTIYDQLVQLRVAAGNMSVIDFYDHSDGWEWGTAPGADLHEGQETGDTPVWPWEEVAKGSGEVTLLLQGEDSDTGIEDQLIAQSVDRLRLRRNEEKSFDLNSEALRLRRLIDHGSADTKDYYRYAQLLIAGKEYDRSVPVLEHILVLSPDHTAALNDLAVIHCWKQDYETALRFYRRSLEVDPNNHDAFRNLLCLLEEMGRHEEMISVLKRINRWNLNDDPSDREIASMLDRYHADLEPATHARGMNELIAQLNPLPDSPDLTFLGYNEDDMTRNGEARTLSTLIQDGDTVFDVGANKGLWSKRVLSLQRNLRLFAFEPVPETFSTLESNVGSESQFVSLHNMAISDRDGRQTFYHYTNTPQLAELSSFYRRPGVEKTLGLDVRPIPVEAKTLDGFCREQEVERIDYLKIDAEGAEYDVLRGAAGLLGAGKIKAVQLEYGGTFADAGISLRQVLELLARAGYSIFRILPDRLLHVEEWRDQLETYQLSNYLAVLLAPESTWGPMKTNREQTVAIIFSKDRALQLQATLNSLSMHCRDFDVGNTVTKVLYTTSSLFHERQYQRLAKEFPRVGFKRESGFRRDLLSSISSSDYVFFMVDDNLFVRDFSFTRVIEDLKMNPGAIGFSLRLGRNTRYCYMLNKPQELPEFHRTGDGTVSFDWAVYDCDFGYPLEVSSSVYRLADILPLLSSVEFSNPNTLEAALDANKGAFQRDKPQLLCYETSVTFCNPANKVQTTFTGNRGGINEGYTADRLANAFLKGYKIDVARYADYVPDSCHQEVAYHFVRDENSQAAEQPIEPDMPLVTIGILNRDGQKHIKICLESIKRNTPEDHEIIVIDNGSTDGSLEYLRSVPNLVLIENPVNLGPTTRNQFLAIARGRYIVFLDNDTIVTRNWLTRFIEHMEEDPEIGIIGACSNHASGPQLVPDTTYQDVRELEEYAEKRAREYQAVTVPSPRLVSFCVFLRREVVRRIGGLDESFGMFGYEDDDYAIRTSIAGFKSTVAPNVFIHHTGGPQGRGDKQYNVWLKEAWEVFKRKWGLSEDTRDGLYDATELSCRPFDKKRHYVSLPSRSSVESRIYDLSEFMKRAELADEVGFEADSTAEDYFKKALACREEGNLDLSIEQIDLALALDDRLPGAHNALGVLYHQKGDIPKALDYFSKAVMFFPDDIDNLKNLASVALEVGEPEDALDLYNNILTIDPNDVETLVLVGSICEQCGQMENALGFFRRALENEPENRQILEGIERVERVIPA